MNEIFVLLETVVALGWVYACTVIALAVGFLIFDHPTRREPRVEDAAQPGLRHAA